MKPQDFDSLSLGTHIYRGFQKYKLTSKSLNSEGKHLFSAEVYLAGGTLLPTITNCYWDAYSGDFSLESDPNLKTKRFYQWLVCHMGTQEACGQWETPTKFYDENGFATDGTRMYYPGVWENYRKVKLNKWIDLDPTGNIIAMAIE